MCKTLTAINLSEVELEEIPQAFCQCYKLQEMRFARNDISSKNQFACLTFQLTSFKISFKLYLLISKTAFEPTHNL